MDELKPCPRINSHSCIDGNGQEYIGIMLKEPEVCSNNLYNGGLRMVFEINHKKQRTEAFLSRYYHGVPQYIRTLTVWKDEILAESECLKYAIAYAHTPERSPSDENIPS